jgi:hypothetical protein
MAKEYDQKSLDKLVSFVKKQGAGNYSETEAVNATGIERSSILRYLIKAEITAFPNLKVPATAAGVLKAKKSGLRWPRVAGYAGISEAKAKELFAEAGGSAEDAYTGRGRKVDGVSGSTRGTSTRSSGGSKKTSASSGRRANAKAASKKTSTSPGRRPGRRTSRASAAADPS